MRILGIDYGTKRIGLAVSDEGAKLAFPHSVITTELGVEKLKKICEENSIAKIVLGRPEGYKGDARDILKKIGNFKKELEKEIKLEIVYENEVLTTRQVKRPMETGRPRGKISNDRGRTSIIKKIDASSAAIILQSYLDKSS